MLWFALSTNDQGHSPRPVSTAAAASVAAAFFIWTWLWVPPARAIDQSADVPSGGRGEQVSAERAPEEERWVPALGLFGGFQTQESRGTIVSGELSPTAPQCTPQPVQCEISSQIQPNADGDDDILAVRLGLSLEIMTPRLADVTGGPRLFIHFDPVFVKGFERNVAGTGNPGDIFESPLPPVVTRSDENVYSGQGSRIFADVSPLVISAGIGVSLSFEIFEQTIRIRPSAEYLSERLSITGEMNRVVQVAQNPRPGMPSDFRFITLRDVDRKRYHAIGAGLDVELDTDRIGPVTISPFVGARAYHYLGDLDVDLSDTNEFGETAEWYFRRDEWQWEARLGIRLRWSPQ